MKTSHRDYRRVEATKLQENLAQTVKRLRKCSGVPQGELAHVLSLHQTAVSRVESGQQSLLPWQLQQLAEFFDLRVNELLDGEINYWRVAEKFGQRPPFPEQYLEFPFSKVREFLPLIQFMKNAVGPVFVNQTLSRFGLDPGLLLGPDQPIGVNLKLDLLRSLVLKKKLTERSLKKLVQYTRLASVQGFLHPLYQTQETVKHLITMWVLNSHHYETNFSYKIEEKTKNGLALSIKPAEHMKQVSYKGDGLDDVLCQYKREYFTQFPQYIGGKPLQLTEAECHFHGAEKCVYIFNVTSS